MNEETEYVKKVNEAHIADVLDLDRKALSRLYGRCYKVDADKQHISRKLLELLEDVLELTK